MVYWNERIIMFSENLWKVGFDSFMTIDNAGEKSLNMLSRKTRTKMQDLRRASSWKPKKEKQERLSILARSKSEGEPLLPEGKAPTPPIVPRKFEIFFYYSIMYTSPAYIMSGEKGLYGDWIHLVDFCHFYKGDNFYNFMFISYTSLLKMGLL